MVIIICLYRLFVMLNLVGINMAICDFLRLYQLSNTYSNKPYAQWRHEKKKATGHPNHVGVWKDMHCKKGKWYNKYAKKDWEKIQKVQEEMNRTLSTMGGDAQPIDEADILESALGSTGSHTRGVGRKVKNPTPNASFGHDSFLQEKLQEQQKINQILQNQINQILGHIGVESSSQYTQDDDLDDEENEENEEHEVNEESDD
ncbi:hypothetical protein QVD17_36937 [Tagetes erecta]|uniref:Uncharacterized protein n=1 Tax=Tagetes erecta TaxID=13708 RepID=A0AAD8NCB2_TARER|nr:hypothetical protein QVD17_36937 [Tagetes erecta]